MWHVNIHLGSAAIFDEDKQLLDEKINVIHPRAKLLESTPQE